MTGKRIAAALLLVSITMAGCAGAARAVGPSRSVYEGMPVEGYRVQQGDWLWGIVRKKGLLGRYKRSELLALLKKLNPEKADLEVLRPGETLRLPIPSGSLSPHGDAYREYRVQAGDTLFSILTLHLAISTPEAYRAYLDRVKSLNPELTDPARLKTGQVLLLPAVSETVPAGKPAPPARAGRETQGPLMASWARIAKALGASWIDEGGYQIPLASGQSVRLSAAQTPLARLARDPFLIVDLGGRLPPATARKIRDQAKAYRLLSLPENIPLKTAVSRFVQELAPGRLLGADKPLELGGAIRYTVWGDWILRPENSGPSARFVIVNLWQRPPPEDQALYSLLKRDLGRRGVRFVEIPQAAPVSGSLPKVPKLTGNYPRGRVRAVVELCGRRFQENVPIVVHRSGTQTRTMTLKADFFLRAGERDVVVDLGSLNPEQRAFLREHRFLVVPREPAADPLEKLAQVLGPLGVGLERGPHSLRIAYGGETRAAVIQVPGVAFDLPAGKRALLLPPAVSPELAALFKACGWYPYRLL